MREAATNRDGLMDPQLRDLVSKLPSEARMVVALPNHFFTEPDLGARAPLEMLLRAGVSKERILCALPSSACVVAAFRSQWARRCADDYLVISCPRDDVWDVSVVTAEASMVDVVSSRAGPRAQTAQALADLIEGATIGLSNVLVPRQELTVLIVVEEEDEEAPEQELVVGALKRSGWKDSPVVVLDGDLGAYAAAFGASLLARAALGDDSPILAEETVVRFPRCREADESPLVDLSPEGERLASSDADEGTDLFRPVTYRFPLKRATSAPPKQEQEKTQEKKKTPQQKKKPPQKKKPQQQQRQRSTRRR